MNQEPIEPEIVTDKEINSSQNNSNKNKKLWAWIWLIASIIYGVTPIDGDVAPVIGWLDDLLFFGAATTNLVQQYFSQGNESLNKLFKIAKLILLSLAVLMLLIIILIVTLIVKS